MVTDTLFEAIPFANISIDSTFIGTTSNIEGYYKLEIDSFLHKKLSVSCIGYQTQKVIITYGKNQKINIQLNPKSIEIDEIVIGPRENPAHPIIKAVIKNKDTNNPEKKTFQLFEQSIYKS